MARPFVGSVTQTQAINNHVPFGAVLQSDAVIKVVCQHVNLMISVIYDGKYHYYISLTVTATTTK